MRVLIYKRTHKGDPDEKGIFGNQDCMGRIRNWNYDAVIGIGGKTTFKDDEDIKYKINWIGLEPKRFKSETKRGDYVTFSHIGLFEEKGKEIDLHYPNLFAYMYNSRKRFDMTTELPQDVYKEVMEILDSVKNYPSSDFLINNFNELEADCLSQTFTCSSCGEGNEEYEYTKPSS